MECELSPILPGRNSNLILPHEESGLPPSGKVAVAKDRVLDLVESAIFDILARLGFGLEGYPD